MAMRVVLAILGCAACAADVASPTNSDFVLPPPEGKTGAPKLAVFIPGGKVPTDYYKPTAVAIQDAVNFPLWFVIPSVFQKLCIITCPSPWLCSPLRSRVQSVVEQAVTAGYKGSTTAPDTFIVGHSLGGVCASNLVKSNWNPQSAYAGMVVLGSYVTNQDVASWPIPVLTLSGELDGGLARPGAITLSLASSDSAGKDLKNKPVALLPGIDHSSFCPGFRVPGDVYPAEIGAAEGSALAGKTIAAFLHQHTDQSAAVQSAGMKTLSDAVAWTREVLAGFLGAKAMEESADGKTAPWCETLQHTVAGLSESDAARLVVASSVYKSGSHEFEHTRVKYDKTANGGVAVNIFGYNHQYGALDVTDSCHKAAKDVGCKMVAADRIAQQLNISNYKQLGCGAGNRRAVEEAKRLLGQTAAGRATLARFEAKGRPFCFGPDKNSLFTDIGPVFVASSIDMKDNGTCLSVSALELGPQPLDSAIFPGVHYCKVLSPAQAVDFMMTDSLKAISGCLNKDDQLDGTESQLLEQGVVV